MREKIDELGIVKLGKIARRIDGDVLALVVAGVDHAPDSPSLAIEVRGVGVLIAGVAVVPVHDPERAVGAHLLADGAKPIVVGFQPFAAFGLFAHI